MSSALMKTNRTTGSGPSVSHGGTETQSVLRSSIMRVARRLTPRRSVALLRHNSERPLDLPQPKWLMTSRYALATLEGEQSEGQRRHRSYF